MVTIPAASEHGEVPAVRGPVVEEGEHSEALRPHKRFRPDDRDVEAKLTVFLAEFLGRYLGLPVRAYAVQRVGFYEWVMVGYAINGRGRNLNQPTHAVLQRRFEDDVEAFNIR